MEMTGSCSAPPISAFSQCVGNQTAGLSNALLLDRQCRGTRPVQPFSIERPITVVVEFWRTPLRLQTVVFRSTLSVIKNNRGDAFGSGSNCRTESAAAKQTSLSIRQAAVRQAAGRVNHHFAKMPLDVFDSRRDPSSRAGMNPTRAFDGRSTCHSIKHNSCCCWQGSFRPSVPAVSRARTLSPALQFRRLGFAVAMIRLICFRQTSIAAM